MDRAGSVGYIAPEVFLGHGYDERVDVFAVGVIMYALVSGSLPFLGRNSSE
jgi:calcium-dependent protein kinase